MPRKSKLSDCILEAALQPGVKLYDASHLMPRIERKRKYRDVEDIDRLFFHHSGALGKAGVAGAWGSANYVVNQRKGKDGKPARFPGPAYTFWIPSAPLVDPDGCLVVLRLNSDKERSWHTGGAANGRGVAAVFQGNTSSKPLTFSHERCASALIPWAVRRYNLAMPEGVSTHSRGSESGGGDKKTCPGKGAELFLESFLARE